MKEFELIKYITLQLIYICFLFLSGHPEIHHTCFMLSDSFPSENVVNYSKFIFLTLLLINMAFSSDH